MTQWIKLALRNILRNKRRSLVTMLAISVGFASISLYYGYIHHNYWALKFYAIHGEGLGHLRINKAGWKQNSKLDRLRYMFTREETAETIKLIREEKEVMLATPQLSVTGMVSNGTTSTVFIGEGIVPKDDLIIKGQQWISYSKVQGRKVSEDNVSGVEISSGLGKLLNLTPGKDGAVMATTLDGQMKALDIKINGVSSTGNDFSNDKFIRFNYVFAQSLLDTQSAERIVVLLKDTSKTEKMRAHLLKKLRAAGIDCEIKAWNELSFGYAKVKSYLDAIFMFLFSIVIFIVVMTILNTMSMVIWERTTEIGTMRALGIKRKGVAILFALEGCLLGFLGSIFGFLLHCSVVAITRYFPMRYTPPGASSSVLMYVDMVPSMLILLSFSIALLSMTAAIILARRAAGKNIVDALGHV